MAVLELWINDSPITTAGGDDFDVLTLGIIGPTDVAPASIHLTGWKKSTSEHCEWLHTRLASNDRVRVVLHKSGSGAVPAAIWKYPNEDYTRTAVEAGKFHGKGVAPEPTPCTFQVELGRHALRASAHATSTLQATATWHRSYNRLRVEVGSVAAEDTDRSCFWVESFVDSEVPVQVALRF